MASRQARILILCKTYPSPSGRHVETTCVAGMEESGHLVRLFPVPFRLVDDEQQFKKWQWIKVRIAKAAKDHRAESHKIFVDTISCEGSPLSTSNNWRARLEALDKVQAFASFSAMDQARVSHGTTLALLRPSKVLGFEVTPPARPYWTEEEKQKLVQH
jgi:hypothetical protein